MSFLVSTMLQIAQGKALVLLDVMLRDIETPHGPGNLYPPAARRLSHWRTPFSIGSAMAEGGMPQARKECARQAEAAHDSELKIYLKLALS